MRTITGAEMRSTSLELWSGGERHLGGLPLRHHVSVRLPDLTVDARCPRPVGPRCPMAVAFSLEEVNRSHGKKHPWERQWSYGWSMMRVGALLRRIDPDLLDRWYEAAGAALHVEGLKPHRLEVAEHLVHPDGPESLAGRPSDGDSRPTMR